MRLAIVIAAAGWLFAAVSARAETIQAWTALDAPVDYAADYALHSGKDTWVGTVIHAPGRERRDFATALGGQAILLRRDTDQIAIIWPKRKWYISTKLSALESWVGGAQALALDRVREGTDTVAGERCTRYRVAGGFAGKMWFAKDGILVKADGMLSFRGRETEVETSLAHIQRAAIAAASFDLPADFAGVPLDPSLFEKMNEEGRKN